MNKVFASDGDQLLCFCMMVIYAVEVAVRGTEQGDLGRDSTSYSAT